MWKAFVVVPSLKRAERKARRRRDREASRRKRDAARAKKENDRHTAQMAALAAQERVRLRQAQDLERKARRIDKLVAAQTSSIEAMNVARLISPRFQVEFDFKRRVTPDMERRLLEMGGPSEPVGKFYK